MKYRVKRGNLGVISLHYETVLCSIFPYSKEKDLSYYEKLAEEKIINDLRGGAKIEELRKMYKLYCLAFSYNRLAKMKVSHNDHKVFAKLLFALIKLKGCENDDFNGWLITNRRRQQRKY